MSPQVELLNNLIEEIRAGSAEPIPLLREICREAADKAPVPDLITMARCLVHIGQQATLTETRRN